MDFGALVKGLGTWWSGLSPERRRAIVVLGVSVLLALVLLARWLGRPSYVPLYTGLEARDAASVVNSLKELRADYRLADEGGTVLVPQEQVYDLRLQLAGQGLLPSAGGAGWEIFDQSKLGSSEFERQVDYQRALQEELRRSIVQFAEVEQARVHLVMPQPSVFIREKQSATASVIVKLKPGAGLQPEQVRSIVYLVSGSVPDLPAANVKVLDSLMRVLSDEVALDGGGLVGGAASQQEAKRALEKDLEKRVEAMLERILGSGQAVAMVSADLDFDQREVTTTTYGREGAVRSEQIQREEGQGQAGAPPPAGDANREGAPTYAGNTPGGNTSYNNSSETRNYELDTRTEKVSYAPGQVRRLSTSVVVNAPLSDQQVNSVREIVSSAIGYLPDRGDSIAVLSMAFDTAYEEMVNAEMAAANERSQRQERLQRYLEWAGRGGAAVLVIVFLLVLLRSRPRLGGLVSETVGGPVGVRPEVVEVTEPLIPTEEVERRGKIDQMRSIARNQPEDAAQLIKTWLSEE